MESVGLGGTKRSFVLVHGGAHGAWCWERLVPFLEASAGVEAVVAVDLSGHGDRRDVKPQAGIRRADYVDDVVREIETRDLYEVVLVGHSLAGITLPLAANRVASRLRKVVYLSTSNPPVGRSIQDLLLDPRSPALREVDARTMFCSDLTQEDAEWLLARLGSEPPGPLPVTVATLPPGISSSYVVLERDEALPPVFQREQAHNAGASEIVSFDAGHSAFVSRPRELAELLLRES